MDRAALWNRAGHHILGLWFPSIRPSIFFFFPSPNLSSHRLDVCRTCTHGVKFRMQVWNVLHEARWKYRTQKKSPKLPSGHHRTTWQAISSQLRHVSTIQKNLLNSNTSPICPYNMMNFGPLVAEIGSLIRGTPANFNGFRVLAALLHGTLVVGVSQTAALNRGRHLYSAGRPSRWAVAHISV